MYYILHGENDLQIQETLNEVIEKTGIAPDFRDLNTEVLEGQVAFGDLRRACSTMPFLGEGRIVIAYDLLSKVKGAAAREIADYLPSLPPTTHLIFVEHKKLSKRHLVLKEAGRSKAQVVHFDAPDARALPGWISARTQRYGGQIEPRAAALLAQNIGDNLRLLDQEIQKLLLYAGDDRRIALEDVRVMVPYVESADVIFQMVDALGQRDPRQAAAYLHRLLAVGEHPLRIFGMVVRQFRLLMQVRWLMDQHYPQQQIVSRLKLHPFVVRKVHGQAARFTPVQLRDAYRQLKEIDLAIKKGQVPQETALDLLIAQLTSL
jgi:DNA polymerase-3 subunit delta